MSKIICDVCGTTYAETAAQCPICGCARNTTAQTAAEGTEPKENGYNYVKGGRFSKANVRKRNKTGGEFQRQGQEPQKPQKPAKEQEPEEGSNKILVAIVVVLLLAIVAVAAYIGIRFFLPEATPNLPGETQGTQNPAASTNQTTVQKIPCTELKLAVLAIDFVQEGDVRLLSVERVPADTTDEILFHSSDTSVATVSDAGKITAVGGGEAVITVVCGDVRAECKIVCAFGDVTPPTTAAPTVPVVPGFELKLNRSDFTLSKEGESWRLFKDTDQVKASDITWTVDDEKVATVVDGKVTGVDYGDTKVYATYGDQTVECWVRVRFHATPEDPDALKLNRTDATIQIGETFRLTLTDSQGVKIDVEFTASEEGYVEITDNKIKGIAHTWDLPDRYITVSCTYDEKTYTCIVRVPKPEEEEKTE